MRQTLHLLLTEENDSQASNFLKNKPIARLMISADLQEHGCRIPDQRHCRNITVLSE